jgi:Cd2+/Zn2+-exporting ATPase
MRIGSRRFFEGEHTIPPFVREWVLEAEREGRTAMLLYDGQRVRGFIAVADTPREEARAVIQGLHVLGRHTVMLTGDNPTVARAVGDRLGLDSIRADLLPEDKQAAVAELRQKFESVAMVGDGINDAPALAAADIGIAMGGVGSAQALETADVVLMADAIHKLPFAVRLSRFANRLIKENIAISLGSKLLVAILALLGYAPLWMAVLADMGVSLLVTMNGLRALRFEPEV